MRHRIFIAINLPEEIKEELFNYQNRFEDEGGWARWTKKDNLHITLEFLGYVDDKDMAKVLEKTQNFALKTTAFSVKLDKIDYFPNTEEPKYIFATGDGYHVTLARIKEWQWRRIDPEERPVAEEDISLEFQVSSIEVMESVLKRSGSEYTILRSYKLL